MRETGAEGVDPSIVHVITSLEVAGAQNMLYKLLEQSDRERFPAAVVSLSSHEPVGSRIEHLGVPVWALDMPPGRLQPRKVAALVRSLRRRRPALVQTWMYHSDLVGGVAAMLADRPKVIWGIRGGLDPEKSKRHSRATARVCAHLSRWVPDAIVSCSRTLASAHVDMGYDAAKMRVIPNGFDTERFRPDEDASRRIRAELDVGDDVPLVGIVGRFDPQKDHETFVRAAAATGEAVPTARFVMCGNGIDEGNEQLTRWIEQTGLASRFNLMGRRDDVPAVTAAMDLVVSSSAYGEGFSNTLGEAMACGVPCVTTDVGDSAFIVGDTGSVVPPRDPAALAREMTALLEGDATRRRELGHRARERVMQQFSIGPVTRAFESLYLELTG